MRRGVKWGIGVALLALFLLGVLTLPGASWLARTSNSLPRPRDPRLVGTWRGAGPNPDGFQTGGTVLYADGRGEWTLGRGNRQAFRWGTADGVLYTRWMATDTWTGTQNRYTIVPEGRIAYFSSRSSFSPFRGLMRHQ